MDSDKTNLSTVGFGIYALVSLLFTAGFVYLDELYRFYYEIGIVPILDLTCLVLPISLIIFSILPIVVFHVSNRLDVGYRISYLAGLLSYPFIFFVLVLAQFWIDRNYPTPYKSHTILEFLGYLRSLVR
jgi:hypothetical protein